MRWNAYFRVTKFSVLEANLRRLNIDVHVHQCMSSSLMLSAAAPSSRPFFGLRHCINNSGRSRITRWGNYDFLISGLSNTLDSSVAWSLTMNKYYCRLLFTVVPWCPPPPSGRITSNSRPSRLESPEYGVSKLYQKFVQFRRFRKLSHNFSTICEPTTLQ